MCLSRGKSIQQTSQGTASKTLFNLLLNNTGSKFDSKSVEFFLKLKNLKSSNYNKNTQIEFFNTKI